MAQILSYSYYKNFLEFYELCVRDVLSEIDIYIKSYEDEMEISQVAFYLGISESEVCDIMLYKNMHYIDAYNFLKIMEMGSSYICRLYKKENECGSPYIYTAEQIAYIYELEIDLVEKACERLGISEIKSNLLAAIFSEISGHGVI